MRTLFALVLCVQVYLVVSQCTSDPCSTTETCCPGPYPGVVGCCPSPNAVCCSDGLHCCPQNTVCNLAQGTCDNKTSPLIPFPFRQREDPPENKIKSSSLKLAQKVEVVYCPGGTSYCPDGSTCCLLATGQYGCCPYPSATCCNDRVHCCPSGYRCDPSSQVCTPGVKDSFWAVAPKRPRFAALPVQ